MDRFRDTAEHTAAAEAVLVPHGIDPWLVICRLPLE